MSTIKQKKLAKNIVENLARENPLNKEELVISSGYAVTTAEGHAPDIIEQKGVQEELKALGFDPEQAKRVVGEILTDGENDNVKLKAADMIFKVHGSYAAEKHMNLNLNVPKFGDEELEKTADALIRLQKEDTGSPRTKA